MAEGAARGWVFAYGSLLWQPEFPPLAQHRATLEGYHRSLCLYSWVHRGTKERPGLVLGLDVGGACHGMVQAYDLHDEPRVLADLDRRELPDDSYHRVRVEVATETGPVHAWAYVVNHASVQYAGLLPEAELLRLVRQGVGQRGRNVDYVVSTVAHLEAIGIDDPALRALVRALQPGPTP
ncbi:MAG: gamma-glutamylcyclotransferase [Geminicoccaceae bacterium]|nr:MAG: gamma-glutamylcyclotransferase [Geminicoccaceae bacterium]